MQSDRQERKLGEALKFANGRTSPERSDDGEFVVYGSNGPIGRSSEHNSPSNTIVIGRVGSYCGAVHFSPKPCWVTDNAIRAEVLAGNHPYYIFSLLRMLDLNRWRSGSGQPLLNQSILSAIQVNLPSFDIQCGIGLLLKQLDDRIELLNQTNTTLEFIAQALFKSWFVDFDPVRAKVEGREPEGMDAETATLFPDALEDSASGEIPKGWKRVRLGDLLELVYGKALKATERRLGSIPVYGSGGVTGFHDEPLVPHGSVVVGRKGTVGSLYWEDGPFYPIDTTFYVKPRGIPLTYCYYAMQCLGLETMNTDAAVPGLNRDNAYRLELIRPTAEVLRAFDDLVTSVRDTMRLNCARARTLSDIRDTLLPRLISGKLRLPEAEAQLNEALA